MIVGSSTGTGMAGIPRARTFRRGASIAALLVAGWCWLALAAPAEGASPGKRLVVAPREGAKLPARPLTIKVRAGRKAVLRARLNGKAIGRYFSHRRFRGVRRLNVSASHGLRHRRNVLRVRVRRPGARRARVATVHFRIATNRPLAAAGLDRTVAVHARLGFDGGRSRLHPPARRRGAGLDYRWRLLRAPPASELRRHGRNPNSAAGRRVKNLGPDALFSRRGSRTPRFRADYPGLYRFRLTVIGDDGRRGRDVVTLRVDPDPLVAIDTMAEIGADAGVKVGDHFYAEPGNVDQSWLQVVALKPDTLELISNTAYDCPEATANPFIRPQYAEVARCVKKLSDGLDALEPAKGDPSPIVIAVSQPPEAGPPDLTHNATGWQTQPPVGAQELLYKIGLPGSVPWTHIDKPMLRGRLSAIGRFGGPATRHDNTDLADLRDTGEIKGYLLADNMGYYTTFESGQVVPFDTQAAGSGPGKHVISIGSQSFPAGTMGEGGFHVLIVDRRDLSVLATGFEPTGTEDTGFDQAARSAEEMKDLITGGINSPSRSGVLVFIQSSGNSRFSPDNAGELRVKLAARQLVDLLQGRLGGTRLRVFRALDPVMAHPARSYRLIARPGTPPGEGLEADGFGVDGKGVPARGYLTRSSVDYGFDVESSTLTGTVGTPGERLRSVALSAPGEWPEKGDPGRTKAIEWVGGQIGLDNRRSQFWTQPYTVDFWSPKVTKLQGLTCPPKPDGFNCTDFDWARKELVDEIGWLESAHAYVKALAEPFTRNQLSSWADVARVAAAVNDKVQAPPTDKTLLELGLIFRTALELAEELPFGAGKFYGIVNDLYKTALEWAKIDAEGKEAGESFKVTVADVGTELVKRLQAIQDTLEGQLVNVIAADYRKLRTVGLCGGLEKECPDPPLDAWTFTQQDQGRAAPAIHDGVEASLYEALLPARYKAWQPPDSANRSTNWFGNQPAGQTAAGWTCPFHNEPETAQVAIPLYRNLANSGPGGPDVWRVIAYAYRTGAGIVNDARVMHLPDASVTDRLFKPPPEGLGLFPESFYWRAFGPDRTDPFAAPAGFGDNEWGFPLKSSETRWIDAGQPGFKFNC